MSKKFLASAMIVLLLLLSVSAFSAEIKRAADTQSIKAPMRHARLIGGNETVFNTAPYIPGLPGLATSSPGDTVGFTQYDFQSNGSTGNRIVLDSQGGIQVAWMNSNNYSGGHREIY